MISEKGYEFRGICTEYRFAYCGYLPLYNFDYGSRLVYGVELLIDSDEEALISYMVDAVTGRIVDSTFLRNDWIRDHTS